MLEMFNRRFHALNNKKKFFFHQNYFKTKLMKFITEISYVWRFVFYSAVSFSSKIKDLKVTPTLISSVEKQTKKNFVFDFWL